MKRLAVPLAVLSFMVACTSDHSPIKRVWSSSKGHDFSVGLMVAILSALGLITLWFVFRRINLIQKDRFK